MLYVSLFCANKIYLSIKKVSNSYDYSLLHKTTTEVAPHAPDPNDEDYWTKFRLLTKEAFKFRRC